MRYSPSRRTWASSSPRKSSPRWRWPPSGRPPGRGSSAAALLSATGLAIADSHGRATAAAGAFAGFWIAYEWWHILGGLHAAADFDGSVRALRRLAAVACARPTRDVALARTHHPHPQRGIVFRRGVRAAARRVRAIRRTLRGGSRYRAGRGCAPALAGRCPRRAALRRRRVGVPDPRRADPVCRLSSDGDLGRRGGSHGLDRGPPRRAPRGPRRARGARTRARAPGILRRAHVRAAPRNTGRS